MRIASTSSARDAVPSASTSAATAPELSRRGALSAAALAGLAPLVGPGSASADAPPTGFSLTIKVSQEDLAPIVVETFNQANAPVATQRVLDLARGIQGVSFRQNKVERITDDFVLTSATSRLSYAGDGRCPIAGGDSVVELTPELEAPGRVAHDQSRLVSLVVADRVERPIEVKLVAVGGKLVSVQTQVGPDVPNGTQLAFTTGPAPELVSPPPRPPPPLPQRTRRAPTRPPTHTIWARPARRRRPAHLAPAPQDGLAIVVGRVVEGWASVEALSRLPTVKDNTSSPFFQAGKAIGDKRASVAERGFKKPFAKAVVSASSLV